jgi:hypothetical protein
MLSSTYNELEKYREHNNVVDEDQKRYPADSTLQKIFAQSISTLLRHDTVDILTQFGDKEPRA